MKSKLLIVNCPSDYFEHVPMGTFGLCDYLNKKNIQTKILNLSLYKSSEIDRVLKHYLEQFAPTHVGVILHWQETAEGALWASEYIKSVNKNIQIICGGFTAGYFGGTILEKCLSIDYIIIGDPEKPMEMLLGDCRLPEIPNLIYRESKKVITNKDLYLIDKDTISSLSFSKLEYLYDHELYIDAIEKKFGFPIFIGRGCVFDCQYCGGSGSAFSLHSNRTRPVMRSIDSVISDLKRLKNFTRKIYICYETKLDYILNLFEAIKKEKELVNFFQLNYGAWRLIDNKFLELYKETFNFERSERPLFEISPEVFSDQGRKKIKNRKLSYSIKDLKENLYAINNCLGNSVKVDIFFSRYHDTAKTYAEMKEEITGIFRFSHELFCNNIFNAKVYFDHLSTDVASRYWENHVNAPDDFDTLVSNIRRLKAKGKYSFTVNNLCIYTPETLGEKYVFRCELIIFILKILEKYYHELFHILFYCLDKMIIELIEEIIDKIYLRRPGNIFNSMDHFELLNSIGQKIHEHKTFRPKIPFIHDLISLQINKAMFYQHSRPQHAISNYQNKKPYLNRALISSHMHDYLDLPDFLERLNREGAKKLISKKTIYIFLEDDILSMPYKTYCYTIKKFEKGISIDEYYELMKEKGIFSESYHKDLVARLFKSNVLY